jgi:hypothetical protein
VIVFELVCCEHHRFEGWFASSEEFDRQRGAGLIACPTCATDRIEKLPTAKIGRAAGSGPIPGPGAQPESAKRREVALPVAAIIEHVLQTTEDVGAAFPDEARRIEHGLAPRRGIRGTASQEEAEQLAEEGISVLWLPIPSRDDWQ